MPSPDRIFILADMHLKPLDAPNRRAREEAVRENERLARFLSSIENETKSLILLGDAFNFWFERRSHVVGDYSAALSLFKLAAENGMEIHHVSGNRDFVIGEGLGFDPVTRYPGFLKLKRGFTVSRLTDFGIEPHGHRYRFHQGGKTVACVHGDALCLGDRAFMMLRSLLQGRLGVAFWRWAPWWLIESIVSHQQGRMGARKGSGRTGDMFDESAVRKELAMGADLLICGHIHSHYEREVDAVGRRGRLVSLPPWLDGYYGILENGEVKAVKFEE